SRSIPLAGQSHQDFRQSAVPKTRSPHAHECSARDWRVQSGAASMTYDLPRRAVAEALGTAFLLAAVVGSGIMGERLAGGNVAIALLPNTIATGATLVALILTFGSISGAHFNPAVTVADSFHGGMPWPEAPFYMGAQLAGAVAGV